MLNDVRVILELCLLQVQNPMSGNHAQKKTMPTKTSAACPLQSSTCGGQFFHAWKWSNTSKWLGMLTHPDNQICKSPKNLRIRSGEIVLPPTPCGQRLTVNTKIGNRKAFGSVSNQLKVCRPGLRCWYISKQICVWNPKFW